MEDSAKKRQEVQEVCAKILKSKRSGIVVIPQAVEEDDSDLDYGLTRTKHYNSLGDLATDSKHSFKKIKVYSPVRLKRFGGDDLVRPINFQDRSLPRIDHKIGFLHSGTKPAATAFVMARSSPGELRSKSQASPVSYTELTSTRRDHISRFVQKSKPNKVNRISLTNINRQLPGPPGLSITSSLLVGRRKGDRDLSSRSCPDNTRNERAERVSTASTPFQSMLIRAY